MTRTTVFTFCLLILIGCTYKSPVGSSQLNDTLSAPNKKQVAKLELDTAFRLDFFEAIPDTLTGCGEYFTYDTIPVTDSANNNKYIFLSNLTDFAIIKIKGIDIYLKKDTSESKEIDDKSYVAVYKGQHYKAILSIKQIKAYDEGGFYSGTLQIISDKINAVFKVHGEAGC
jgi:hypothetical protein